MSDFLRKLFGLNKTEGAPPPKAAAKPPIPPEELAEFEAWVRSRTKPAVELRPDPSGDPGTFGSRLGGPAWLAGGEAWPMGASGTPLEHLAQIDCADLASLGGYPAFGFIQFFIGRDDLFGADFSDLFGGTRLVRWVDPRGPGEWHAPPALEEQGGEPFSDFSPFMKMETREHGVRLKPLLIDDIMDWSNRPVEELIAGYWQSFESDALDDVVERLAAERPMRHHCGGYPAFTQSDIRHDDCYADLDHVLLRVTSDDHIMWGDVGEAVFMMRSADLAAQDFSRVAYSWDCH